MNSLDRAVRDFGEYVGMPDLTLGAGGNLALERRDEAAAAMRAYVAMRPATALPTETEPS
ncbi:hypothetical protein [Achromobacter spanius]|uniref:hypothetical protein n=1 Tax=Achromobacter spanius TaxID=217203 RepID=UPI0037F6E7AC